MKGPPVGRTRVSPPCVSPRVSSCDPGFEAGPQSLCPLRPEELVIELGFMANIFLHLSPALFRGVAPLEHVHGKNRSCIPALLPMKDVEATWPGSWFRTGDQSQLLDDAGLNSSPEHVLITPSWSL